MVGPELVEVVRALSRLLLLAAFQLLKVFIVVPINIILLPLLGSSGVPGLPRGIDVNTLRRLVRVALAFAHQERPQASGEYAVIDVTLPHTQGCVEHILFLGWKVTCDISFQTAKEEGLEDSVQRMHDLRGALSGKMVLHGSEIEPSLEAI